MDYFDEDEDDYHDYVPHTDLPEVILVEEDEYTEKVDNEQLSNIQNTLDQTMEAEKDNQINYHIAKSKQTTSNINPATTSLEAPDHPIIVATEEYTQPRVEVINAGDEKTASGSVISGQAEALLATPADPRAQEARPRARVAFADPTLRSNPSTPVRAAKKEEAEGELTLASLGTEEESPDPVEETPQDRVAEPRIEPTLPPQEAAEGKQLLNLGDFGL